MPGQLYASDNHRNRLPFVRLAVFVFEIVSQDASAIPFQIEGANNAKTNDPVERRCGRPTSKASGAITRAPSENGESLGTILPGQNAADCGVMWHFRWQVACVVHLVAKGAQLRHPPHRQRPFSTNKHR